MISREFQQRFLAALNDLQVGEESIGMGNRVILLAQFGRNQRGQPLLA